MPSSSTRPSFKRNSYGLKSSCDMYRNVRGVHFVHWTSDTSKFDEEREEARKKGLKSRIIKGELFIEKKPL